MKFDFIIGNPPYQEDVQNEGDRANPIYDKFIDEAYKLADVVELIHPARFLFGAGQTSKKWNEKMLSDPHIRVLFYESKSSNVFQNTDIKGGVAITLRNSNESYGAIGVFTAFNELNKILSKVTRVDGALFLDSIVSSRGLYRFSPHFYKEYPDASEKVGKGSGNMVVSNSFDCLSDVFSDFKPDSDESFVEIIGRKNNSRTSKWIKKSFIIDNEYINSYKVLLPEANGSGALGEVLTTPLICEPSVGATDTFISIGPFKSKLEAEFCLKYIKTKFARCMLGVNKVTQHNPKSTWKAVPLQDFTLNSDIDWSKPISDIDVQLYKKYGLDDKEIEFIESHVKEME